MTYGLHERANDFAEVLYGDDQMTVRRLVTRLMTAEQKAQMIELYNQHVDRYNAFAVQEAERSRKP